MINTDEEILAIVAMVLRINALGGDHILSIDVHQTGVVLWTFDCNNKVQVCETIYEFEDDYYPRLRFLRHRLENMASAEQSEGQS